MTVTREIVADIIARRKKWAASLADKIQREQWLQFYDRWPYTEEGNRFYRWLALDKPTKDWRKVSDEE